MKCKWFLQFIMIFMLLSITACGPAKVEQFVEIKPNETAFLVPLEGGTKSNQKKFGSIEYLEAAKIPAKRISLPLRKHSTGRLWSDYKYIPTMKVITVSRAPVTREWTSSSSTGTTNQNEALYVESKDSIEFGVGVNITAMVMEEDTALFLYTFGGIPIWIVVDNNVRGFSNSVLSAGFAEHNLEEGRGKKNEIFADVATKTIEEFKKYGVTITNIGLAEGMIYRNPEIQIAINAKFIAEMQVAVEEERNKGQAKINTRNVAIAKAEKDAAKAFAKAAEARKKMVSVEVSMIDAQARLVTAQKWDGKLPANILPSNSPLLMNLQGVK